MALTMINPTEVVELPLVKRLQTMNVNGKELLKLEKIFDKSSGRIAKLVSITWLSRYPWCHQSIYDNGSEFKLHFEHLCDSYGIKCNPTIVKNTQVNATLEHMHQVLRQMLCTSESDMADSISPDDVDVFLDNAAWAINSTYRIVLNASTETAIFGWDMLFDIPFMADWYIIGEHRQSLADRNNMHENKGCIDYDYKIGDWVLIAKDGILCKSESKFGKETWAI